MKVKFGKCADGTINKDLLIFTEELFYNEKVRAAKEELNIDLDREYHDGMFNGMKNGEYFCYYKRNKHTKLTDKEIKYVNKKLQKLPYNCRIYYDTLFDDMYILHDDLCGPAGTWARCYNEIKISINKFLGIYKNFSKSNCRQITINNEFVKALLKGYKE